MSQSLPCLFSQSSLLYDVQASALFVFAVLPSVRSPSLHPGTSNRCPRDLECTPCRRHCRAAEEQGELSWPNMLIHQDTSPSGFCLTLGLQWRLVLQVCFEARYVATLSRWQICWQAGDSGQLGFNTDVCCANQVISVFFHNRKEGPLRMIEAVPLYRPHYGKWRHMPPREFFLYTCHYEHRPGVS